MQLFNTELACHKRQNRRYFPQDNGGLGTKLVNFHSEVARLILGSFLMLHNMTRKEKIGYLKKWLKDLSTRVFLIRELWRF